MLNIFAEIYVAERSQEAIAVWKWSTAHPDRVILQDALQSVLKRSGREPEMA